jgi:hypothetical protein
MPTTVQWNTTHRFVPELRLWFDEPPYLLNSISLWFFAHIPISVAFRLGDLLYIGIDCPAATWGFGAAMTADDVDSNKASASRNEGNILTVKREEKTKIFSRQTRNNK